MNPKSLLNYLAPYLAICFVIALVVFGFFIFSYILIFAFIIGLVVFCVNYIRAQFFNKTKHTEPLQKKSGRLIEHDEHEGDNHS